MADTMRPEDMAMSATPTFASNTLPDLSLPPKAASKPSAPRAPRIDIEPLYGTVKSAISDADWTLYKTSLSSFLLGNLNQEELTCRLDQIFTRAASGEHGIGRAVLERAHNALMMGVYANVWRDAPEAGIASWVSSSDKISSSVPKGTGDESEKRLKQEVMQISRRERKRLKTLHPNVGGNAFDFAPMDAVGGIMMEYHEARRVKLPEAGPAAQAGGYGKTNWDLEIRKRYQAPLFSETHEFPTTSTITTRLLPLCYESGLPQGHSSECAEFLNIATETFIKEALTNILTLVSANGTGYVRTAEYKKRVEKEEAKVAAGEMVRVGPGELPVEAEERRKRRPLCMEDMRLALKINDGFLGQIPILSGEIANLQYLDTPGLENLYPKSGKRGLTNGVSVNGAGARTSFYGGMNLDAGDPMDIDEDPAWQGGSVKDVDELDGALDAVLELADL